MNQHLRRAAAFACLWAGGLAAVEQRSTFATLENGLSVGFGLVRTSDRQAGGGLGGAALAQSNSVSRVLVDKDSGAYFGYRLSAERAPGNQVRLVFQALSPQIEGDLRRAAVCPSCPTLLPLSAAAPRLPGVQLVKDGQTLSLELLGNPTTGERIIDVVMVSSKPVTAPAMQDASERTLRAWKTSERAAILVARGSYAEALPEYRAALELMPIDAALHNRLGVCQQHLGQTDAARKSYERALVLQPNYAEAWNNLGTLEQSNQHLRQAVRAYRKAVELKPALATPWMNLGSTYLALGRVQEGVDAYSRAFRLDPAVLESSTGLVDSGIDAATQDYYLAKMFAAGGRAELALEFLLKASASGFHDWSKVAQDRDFKLLENDARFRELVDRGTKPWWRSGP